MDLTIEMVPPVHRQHPVVEAMVRKGDPHFWGQIRQNVRSLW
jgi:hypothetical protein